MALIGLSTVIYLHVYLGIKVGNLHKAPPEKVVPRDPCTIFLAYIWLIFIIVNVGKYTSPMDAMVVKPSGKMAVFCCSLTFWIEK